MASDSTIHQAIEARQRESLDTLFRLLRQPSISTQGIGVEECAELVRTVLEEHGVPAQVMPTGGLPVVYGELKGSESANTLLIYGHYDVQPPEPYEEWISPPFEPAIRDGRIYARGSGDNKGQFLAHILAIRLLAGLGELPDLTIKFLLEGEEENGSPSLPAFVEQNRDLLAADLFYAADGPMHPSNRPFVFFGVRGMVTLEIEVTGANRDLHSGNFGGPIPNAAWKLVELLGTMRGPDGRATIEGFYDDVVPPTGFERTLLERIPFDPDGVKAYLDIDEFAPPHDIAYYEKLMFQPTLNIAGISGGYTGEGMKTVIPSSASVKIDCRLVKNQDPDDILAKIERHVAKHAPGAVVRKSKGNNPSKTSPELPVSRMAVEAVGAAYGVEPVVLPLLGATAPNDLFTDVLGQPAIWTTYGPPDENNHAPNENMTLDSFFNGIAASAEVIRRFAAMPRSELDGASDD